MCNAIYRNMLLSPVYEQKLVALVIDEAHCVKSLLVNIFDVCHIISRK